MTDIYGNLLWYGEYTAWGRLKKDERSNNYRLEKGTGKGGNSSRGAQNRSRYDMTDPIVPRQKSNYGHD